jgi:hypothetical protein
MSGFSAIPKGVGEFGGFHCRACKEKPPLTALSLCIPVPFTRPALAQTPTDHWSVSVRRLLATLNTPIQMVDLKEQHRIARSQC